MINIIEKKSNKIPTKTSLFVTFDYKQEIVDEIKKLKDVCYWDKKSLEWEMPITVLSSFIKAVNYYDDIDITLLDNTVDSTEAEHLVQYKVKPMSQQLSAIEYGLIHNKWLLLDQVGLGKTGSIIYLAEELYARKEIEHCLIICGKNSLKSNWENEIKTFSRLDSIILGKKISKNGIISYASVKERCEQLKNKINEFFIITNIETLQNKEIIEAFNKSKNKIGMIALDEAHVVKDPTSKSGANLLKLNSKYKVAATGTLILNKPTECYTALKWTDNINCSFTDFKKYYCTLGGNFSKYEITGYKHLDLIQDLISNCSLRRLATKEYIPDLPEKNIINELLDMEDDLFIYKQVLKACKAKPTDDLTLLAPDIDKVKLIKGNELAMATRFKQATQCPQSLSSKITNSTKIDRACELAEEIINSGNKVIISCYFKDSIKYIAEKLIKYEPLILDGDTSESDVLKNKELFNNNENKKLLLFTWPKMGTGHTLTAANYMICVDTAYTPGQQEQTEGRIYRKGQNKPVFIYRLFCKNTWDEHCMKLLESKQAVSDYLIDNNNDQSIKDAMNEYLNSY